VRSPPPPPAACPVSTRGGTRLVRLVRGRGGVRARDARARGRGSRCDAPKAPSCSSWPQTTRAPLPARPPSAGAAPPPPSLPYKVDTSRPSLRTNWTRLVPLPGAPTSRLCGTSRPRPRHPRTCTPGRTPSGAARRAARPRRSASSRPTPGTCAARRCTTLGCTATRTRPSTRHAPCRTWCARPPEQRDVTVTSLCSIRTALRGASAPRAAAAAARASPPAAPGAPPRPPRRVHLVRGEGRDLSG